MSMFGQQKPTASLSSTLLARKGQAKPAMRPQGFGGFGTMTGGYDDLGWNDMGSEQPAEEAAPAPLPASAPPVLVQREILREEFAAPVVAPVMPVALPEPVAEIATPAEPRVLKPVSVATAARLGRETAQKGGKKTGKAAFTLRLDQDRHLRLRIASALNNASAQTLVTEALDHFLQSLPEVDALVAQLPPRTSRATRKR